MTNDPSPGEGDGSFVVDSRRVQGLPAISHRGRATIAWLWSRFIQA